MTTASRTPQADLEAPVQFFGSLVSILVSGAQTNQQFAIVRSHVTQGCEPPRHIHQHEDEVIYVSEGQLLMMVGDERLPAPAGSYVLLPRCVEHSFVLDSEEATLLHLYLPPGLERSLQEFGREAQADAIDGAQVEQLIALTARYGIEITGPPR